MVSLAIIGARTFDDYDLLCTEVTNQCKLWDIEIKDIDAIVGGHCKGADMLGEKFAQENKIPKLIFKPDWAKYGKRAGFLRNHDIVNNTTHIIAFPSVRGAGTQHSIRLAETLDKPMHIVEFDRIPYG